MTASDEVDSEAQEFGAKVQSRLPALATYIRVDLVRDEDWWIIMEIEVNEPALGLDLADGAASRFASALLA